MKDIIIISYGYDGEKSNNPNAICLYEIINSLSEENKIYIITSSTTTKEYYIKTEGNIEIHYIPIVYNKKKKLDFEKWGIDVIVKIDEKIVINNTSTLFTISFPFNIQTIGFHLKKQYPQLRWIVYELDPYAYNLVLRYTKILFLYRYYLENKVFKKADHIMLTHELFEQYSKNLYSKYSYKLKDIGIPLMKIHDESSINKNKTNNICNVSYIGSFYAKIREPNYMLEVMGKVSDSIENFEMHFYGPSPESIPYHYIEEYGESLFLHGRVSKESVLAAINDANIFINVGNAINNQLPSKVLEYIGTGKPIINFYCISDDTSNKYLERYPNVLLIEQNQELIDENIKRVIDFISKFKGTRLSREIVLDLYKEDTIDSVKDKISKILFE